MSNLKSGCILLTIGIPASGKSTLCNKFKRQLETSHSSFFSSTSPSTLPLNLDSISIPNCGHSSASASTHEQINHNNISILVVSFDELMSKSDLSNMVIHHKPGEWKQFRENVVQAAFITIYRHYYMVMNNANVNDYHDQHDQHEYHLQLEKECQLLLLNQDVVSIYRKLISLNGIESEGGTSSSSRLLRHKASDLILIVDDNLYYTSMRYPWFKLANKLGLGFVQFIIDCPLELALQRNRIRDEKERVADEVIVRMSERIELPDNSESSLDWQRNTLRVSVNDLNTSDMSIIYDEMRRMLINTIHDPLRQCIHGCGNDDDKRSEILLQQHINATNLIHQVDCVLRDLIRMRMNEIEKKNKKQAEQHEHEVQQQLNDKRQYGKCLSLAKQSLLRRIRSDSRVIPDEVVAALTGITMGIQLKSDNSPDNQLQSTETTKVETFFDQMIQRELDFICILKHK